MADAILGESADLAVIAFERVEVRVGGANQDFAGSPFGGRNVIDQPRARRGQQRKRRVVDVSVVELFDFEDLAAIDS